MLSNVCLDQSLVVVRAGAGGRGLCSLAYFTLCVPANYVLVWRILSSPNPIVIGFCRIQIECSSGQVMTSYGSQNQHDPKATTLNPYLIVADNVHVWF
jgi:hypothetical protein